MSTAFTYTILSGDSYSSIANGIDAAAGVTYQAIEAQNPNYPASALQPGNLLNIPGRTSSAIALKYTVQSGDSYSRIATNLAKCAGITYQLIESANPNIPASSLRIGQHLAIPATNSVPAPTPAPSTNDVVGLWYWTWSANATPPADANLGLAFSGYVDPQTALSSSSSVKSKLPGIKYICLGGGNEAGSWASPATVTAVTDAIHAGDFAGYSGIAYDIEEGCSELETVFANSFAAAKAMGFQVLVTISHSAPYGIFDAATLMRSFFYNSNIDILSPQLYTTGSETANDYAISSGVQWNEYAAAKALVAPSIVEASMYASAQTYFAGQGVTLGGFVQWSQSSMPLSLACRHRNHGFTF